MADYFGVTPAGAVPYNAGYMQTANSHLHGLDYAAQLRAQIAAHQPRPNPHQPKARARDVSSAHQQPAQPRHDDNNDIGDGLEENCFALVSTAELEQQGLKQHPDKIAEAASLNSVSLPAGKYRLGLPAFIIQGRISALQFQSVRLACQRHETYLPDKTRAGFFLGDGPGVGKGRQIASVIFENLLRGREKAVWFSATGDLAQDAKRDFRDIGALAFDIVRLHDLKHSKVKAGDKLADAKGFDCGVLFSTYDLLISGKKVSVKSGNGVVLQHGEVAEENECDGLLNGPPVDKSAEARAGKYEFPDGSRLSQIVEWLGGEQFDGAIVFDECHKAKNCVAKQGDKGRRQSESKTSRAVVEIQRRLPNARILYVSATGATEAENLCYMTRLGLWGDQTAFANKQEFVNMLTTQGVAAMELVAMELKQSGSFIARTLSYEGVEFEQQHVNISDEYKAMYDAAAAVWLQVREAIEHCKDGLQILDGRAHKSMLGLFYGGLLRFFRQLCTAAKVETVAQLAHKTLEEGKCIVIGLQSTGEARTEAMVSAAQKDDGHDGSFDAFAEPANLILYNIIDYLPEQFPKTAELRRKAAALKLPGNPLDDLIEKLGGVDKVAEMSGRKRRMVKQPDGKYKYLSRSGPHTPLDGVNIAEKDAFQSGKKLVAVISDAASTGISLHADRSRKNTRQRVHVTLELAWSADKTVQQLGRSHRSNQLQPPKYVIVSTDICGEHRFASAVANRLQQLGALTHGDRRAASAADALSGFNLQNKFAQAALRKMYQVLLGNLEPPEDVTPSFIDEEMSGVGSVQQQQAERRRLFMQFIPDGKDALMEVGVLQPDAKQELDQQMAKQQQAPGGNINKLLNRLLGCQVDMQSKIFGYFSALQDAEIKLAKENGTYNESGIIKPRGETIAFKRKDVIYQDEYSGMCTYHAEFEIDRGMNYEAAVKCLEEERKEDPDTQAGFYTTCNSARTWNVLALPRDAMGRKLKRVKDRRGNLMKAKADYYRIIRPATGFSSEDLSASDFKRSYKSMKETNTLKSVWNQEWRTGKNRHQALHLITGSILPILPTVDRLLRGTPVDRRMWQLQVMRVESTDGQHQEVGLYLSDSVANTGKMVLKKIRDLQPLKPWQFAGGANSMDLAGRGPAPGDPLPPRQAPLALPAATPADPLLLDEAEKENAAVPKPKKATAAREPGEKRARRRKSEATADPDDMEEDVVAPEVMAAAGLWEDIQLPARRKVAEVPAPKCKPPRPSKQIEPVDESEAETEDFGQGKEHDSDSDDSSASKADASKGSKSGNKRSARPQRASKDRAAKATAGTSTAADLDSDDSDKENAGEGDRAADEAGALVSSTDKAKQLRAMSSRLRAARAGKTANGEMSPAAQSDDEHNSDAEPVAVRTTHKRGSSRTALTSRSSSPAESDSGRAEAKGGSNSASDADEASPAPAMLKSRKGRNSLMQKGRNSSREGSVAIKSNSEVSDGWVVKCKCGATDDDGEAMTECEGGCKTWVHDSCHGLADGALYWCEACKENVQTSRPATGVSDSGLDSGESQSTPVAVDSLAGALDTDRTTVDASAAAAVDSLAGALDNDRTTVDASAGASAVVSSPASTAEKGDRDAIMQSADRAKASSDSRGSKATAAEGSRAASDSPRTASDHSRAAADGPRPASESPAQAEEHAEMELDLTAASPAKPDADVVLQSAKKTGKAQLCVRTGRVEKLRRRLLTKNRAGAALPGSSSEVIDLQDSSREATPELNSGKAATAIKAAANKTATAVISGSPENSQLHPAGQSAASSSPAQKARLPTAPQAAPSSPAPRALQPTASRGLWSPAQKAPLPTVPQASSSSPAPRALQPTASRPLSSPAQNASQAASPGLPVPQSSLTRCASQTTPLRPQRPVRDLTNSIEGARGVAAEGTPSKATPSKRARNAAVGEDQHGSGSADEVVLVGESTPGKRRKSLVPSSDRSIQEQPAQQQEAAELAKLRSRCAALEAAAATQQAERQQAAASVTAPDEASMRRSIQAECDKKLKEEKLGLIKRTLAVGKKAGRSEAEKELQEQLQTLKGQTAAASQDLQASRTAFQQERATWQEQQQAWQAQQAKHAASAKKHEADNLTLVAQQQQQKQQWEAERAQAEADFKCSQAEERESWRRQQQQWETERAQREAQAELEFKRKQHQWEAERAAQAQHAQQLQTEMAAMKADLEQYKAALAAAKHDTGFAQTAGRSGNGTPLTPHTPGHALGGGAPGAGKITEAAASTPVPEQQKVAKGGADTASKRVSWAPLPVSEDIDAEPEEPGSPISKDAVLTWLQNGEASLPEISTGLKAKQQQAALSDIMQELQDDFEVAMKAGRYFLL